MPIRRWKYSLAAGILLIGAESTFGQSPPCVRPAAPARLRSWFGRFEAPDAQPFGLSVTSHFEGHVMAGTAARMVFHDYDFLPGSDRLNYRGVDQVHQVARLMGVSPAPVVIERLPRDPQLAERRRLAVLAALASVDPKVSPTRVVVAEPIAFPLRGSEAELIYKTMVRQTEMMGALPMASMGGNFAGGVSGATGQPVASGR